MSKDMTRPSICYLHRIHLVLGVIFLLGTGLTSFSALAGVPRVVVSIAPIHSLVSAVMRGVGEPVLLITGGQSPHTSSLKPSSMRALSRADLLVWIGPEFELSLTKAADQQGMQQLSLLNAPAMHRLPIRDSGLWLDSHAEHEHLAGNFTVDGHTLDAHLWLSAENARAIVKVVAKSLAKMDPDNAGEYQRNAQQTNERIDKITDEIARDLRPLKAVSYLVFHDAYQYFEEQFGLSPAGAVTLSPERKPGIKTLLAIKEIIHEQQVQCIFHEPQFQPRLVKRIAAETGIRTGELDPIGANLAPGPDQWFQLMLGLRDSLLECLAL